MNQVQNDASPAIPPHEGKEAPLLATPGGPAAIELQSVTKCYPSGQVTALRGVTLSLREGEVLGLVGPNGAGKTTLLRLVLGLAQPTSGAVHAPPRWRPGSRDLACVLDGDGAYPDLTVADNMRFFGSLYGLSAAEALGRGLEYLDHFGLAAKADTLVQRLSQGQRRLVSLCRAMLPRPSLLVLDELTANLDPDNQRRLVFFLRRLGDARGTTILFSSHDLHHVEVLAQRVVLIAGGQVRAEYATAAIGRHRCHSLIGCRHDKPLAEALNEFRLCGFEEPGGRLCVILPADPGRERELGQLVEKLGGCRVETRPASLEDMYLAAVGGADAR